MVKSWIYRSVATLVAHKSESGEETNCYKNKSNTIEVILDWLLATPRTRPPPPQVLAFFALSLLKIRAAFLNVPQCLPPYFSEMKKDLDKQFSPL